jgi:hypothetical protein
MRRTVSIHCAFVTAKLACSGLIALEDVLHCDKTSSFRHIEAAPDGLLDLVVFSARTI